LSRGDKVMFILIKNVKLNLFLILKYFSFSDAEELIINLFEGEMTPYQLIFLKINMWTLFKSPIRNWYNDAYSINEYVTILEEIGADKESPIFPKYPCWYCGSMYFIKNCDYKNHCCKLCSQVGHEGSCGTKQS